ARVLNSRQFIIKNIQNSQFKIFIIHNSNSSLCFGEEVPIHLTPSGKKLVTLIPGDGIGPEVIESARRIIAATGAPIEWEERQAGASIFKKGLPSGVPPETIESVVKTRVALKGPLETPVGFGEKSGN